MRMASTLGRRALVQALCLTLVAAISVAFEPPPGSPIQALAFQHPDLYIDDHLQAPASLPALVATRLRAELSALGLAEGLGYYDLRGDRWGTLIVSRPMIPGPGVDNQLTWASLGLQDTPGTEAIGQAAWAAFRGFLVLNQGQLRVDPRELGTPQISVLENGRLVQINAGRHVLGVPVRDASVTAVLNSGNLVLFGATRWGDLDVSPIPTRTSDEASDTVAAYVLPVAAAPRMAAPELRIVPFENGNNPATVVAGRGYRHRLVWAMRLAFEEDQGDWEALVDAHSGELLAFADQNQYLARQIVGGVYPASNDGRAPDGIEQPGWPMPFAFVAGAGTPVTNSSGVVPAFVGPMTTPLAGPYIRMNDSCGLARETSGLEGNLDLGDGPGTDCEVPPGHSVGDTHASRTGFYELNRIKEQSRGWLPANPWLYTQLTSNMNINNSCNAFWTTVGATINFYRRGNGCANTGEIAAVFDHEYGHGLDNFDGRFGVSSSGEAYADVISILRLNQSCVGRGFRENDVQCGGNGDRCLECSGVRQVDWTKRLSGLPHNIDWIRQRFDNPGQQDAEGNWIRWPGGCDDDVRTGGPCNQGVHCEGSVSGEAWWDLMHRDLAGQYGSPFDWDNNTRLNFAARLAYMGMNNVGTWFSCAVNGFGGCGATSAYMNFLTVDDDNGNLADGTPHMTAVYNAHHRHQLACATPVPQNSGCAGRPTQAPTVTVTPLDNGARIGWTAVPGATKYWLFKADGLYGCEAGKELILNANLTEFIDINLVNGREFFYTVMAVGAHDSCQGPASACVSTIPRVPPTAEDVGASTDEDTDATVTLRASDPDSATLDFSVVAGPSHGSAGAVSPACTPQGDGASCTATVTYSPDANYAGADSFTYRATDEGGGESNVATASLSVRPVNDAPTAQDAAAECDSDATNDLRVHARDIDSGSLGFAIVSSPAHGAATVGSVECTPSGGGAECAATVTYTPQAGYDGPDSFTFRATDGDGAQSNEATVSLTVSRPGKTTGAGHILVPDGEAYFGFSAQQGAGAAKGQLDYQNAARALHVQSVAVQKVRISGNTAVFEGTCTKNGAACTFRVTAQDNGHPGDQFVIEVSGEPAEGTSGPIAAGNIQVHRK